MGDYVTTMAMRTGSGPDSVKPAGSHVTMDDAKAAPMVRRRALVPADDVTGAQMAVITTVSGDRIQVAPNATVEATVVETETVVLPEGSSVEDAIKSLKPGDFTATGKPKTEAIEMRLGGDARVSAADRDKAFDAMVKGGFTVPT